MATSKKTAGRVIDRIAGAGSSILSLFSGLLAAFLILYSSYVLYDTMYTQRAAESPWDLLQYKPEIIDDEAAPLIGADMLAKINEDYRAWLTIYDTKIDYPVMQGLNDLYYSSHDIYRKSSLTGSIYLAHANTPDFTDKYNIIYGHHMDVEAMFGSLDRFAEKDYFNAHRDGVLVLQDRIYDLKIFAVFHTDAYDGRIYDPGNPDIAKLLEHVKTQEVLQYDERVARGLEQLVALSTCSSSDTNGRLVVFAKMSLRKPKEDNPQTVVPTQEDNPDDPTPPSPGKKENPEEDGTDIPAPVDGVIPPVVTTNPDGTVSITYPQQPVQEEHYGTIVPMEGIEIPEAETVIEDAKTPISFLDGFLKGFQPKGSRYGRNAWALLNLICLIITIYLFIPLLHLKAKFTRGRLMKKVNSAKDSLYEAEELMALQEMEKKKIREWALYLKNKEAEAELLANDDLVLEYEQEAPPSVHNEVEEDEFDDAVEKLYYEPKPFRRRFWIGLIAELVICIVALFVFLWTEDMRLPMVLIDRWTILMILFMAACWLVDVRLIRYRKKTPEEKEEEREKIIAKAEEQKRQQGTTATTN